MPSDGTILSDVVSSIFTPGTNSGLVQAMSYSFYGLFLTLIGMLFLTKGNGHVWALFGLSLGLFISIKWFLVQIAPIEADLKVEREAQEAKDKLTASEQAALERKGKKE